MGPHRNSGLGIEGQSRDGGMVTDLSKCIGGKLAGLGDITGHEEHLGLLPGYCLGNDGVHAIHQERRHRHKFRKELHFSGATFEVLKDSQEVFYMKLDSGSWSSESSGLEV